MTIAETMTYVRGLDDWKKTRQAQTLGASLTQNLLRTFGAVSS
jgi:hypothetical protein